MKSVGSHHGGAEMQYPGAGDPDNSGQAESGRPLVATVETVLDGSAPQIRMSAIAEPKQFNGKDKDEDRARIWIGKSVEPIHSPLVEGPAGKIFVQYGGNGMSIGRQYYLAKKRPEETPQDYLYRLNEAEHRAKTLRAYQHMEDQQTQSLMVSNKFCPRSAPTASPTPAKSARAMRTNHVEDADSSSESDLSGSDAERELCNEFVAATSDRPTKFGDQRATTDENRQAYSPDRVAFKKACSNCGLKKHDDRGCWQRLTCQKCDRKGHPSDKCFFVCAACNEIHENGKCPMDEFYNLIRKWYVPTKYSGMFTPKVKEMLN
uniref:CCHC-type domain-containing protein n=1 Tax=Hyaloperonospora arabidopsidis (strain Emoy2) TaxID=559515 RepID=M4BAA1_HYAAE